MAVLIEKRVAFMEVPLILKIARGNLACGRRRPGARGDPDAFVRRQCLLGGVGGVPRCRLDLGVDVLAEEGLSGVDESSSVYEVSVSVTSLCRPLS
ncbi:hypothetical protein [Streptomyces sp. NPDC002265]|uniref:hypothetical protein n=1 Tax=Streptomyces sp. NPDC002265 TaxID=3154415 RepID=UPI003326B617